MKNPTKLPSDTFLVRGHTYAGRLGGGGLKHDFGLCDLSGFGGGRERRVMASQYSEVIKYDHFKQSVQVYLADYQLVDKDLLRFIEWFDADEQKKYSIPLPTVALRRFICYVNCL